MAYQELLVVQKGFNYKGWLYVFIQIFYYKYLNINTLLTGSGNTVFFVTERDVFWRLVIFRS